MYWVLFAFAWATTLTYLPHLTCFHHGKECLLRHPRFPVYPAMVMKVHARLCKVQSDFHPSMKVKPLLPAQYLTHQILVLHDSRSLAQGLDRHARRSIAEAPVLASLLIYYFCEFSKYHVQVRLR